MKLIYWDCDDVLNELMKNWLMYFNLTTGKTFCYTDIIENPPYQILNISKNDYLLSLDSYRLNYYNKLQPNKQILCWFEQNGKYFYHQIITSTSRKTAHVYANWIMKYFGNWIQTINFVYSNRNNCTSVKYFNSKKEWLKQFGIKDSIFIDDTKKNIQGIDFIHCLNFKQPWNDGITFDEISIELGKK